MSWSTSDLTDMHFIAEEIVCLSEQIRNAQQSGSDTLGDTVQTSIREAEDNLDGLLSMLGTMEK